MVEIYDVHFWLTNLCNSKCNTCEMWKNKNKKEIPLDVVKSVVESESIVKSNSNIALVGGEPTLYSSIIDLVKYLNDNQKVYFFITNAIWISKLKEIFSKAGYISNLSISMDGYGERHDEIRGVPGNFENILKLISWVRGNYPLTKIRVGYTISPYNTREDFDQVYDFCSKENIYIKLCYFIDSKFFHSKAKHVNEMLYYVGDKIPDPYALIYPLWKTGNLILKCTEMKHCPYIMQNGDVIICMEKYIVLGNVYKESFDDIWAKEENFEKLKEYENCQDCWGGCYRSLDVRKIYEKFIGKDAWRVK
jgi:MoaA/NifB/PqqE/SkfB family radical SAM enzyme